MTKNILYIHDARFLSGIERVLLDIFHTIDKTRFTPYFIGSKWSDGHLIEHAKELGVKCGVTNLEFIQRTCNPLVLARYFWNLLASAVFIYNFICQNKINFISVNCLLDLFYAFLPAAILRKPIIWHQHAIRPIDGFTGFVISILGIKVNKYIAVSKAVTRNLSSFGVAGEKIEVVYNGVIPEKFSYDEEKVRRFHKTYNLDEDVIYIGLISQFEPGKGHEDFLKAATIISSKYKNVKFLIAGKKNPSEYFNKVKNLVKELGLTDRVILTGWIENIEEMSLSLYAHVQPNYMEEPCSIGLLEAMASGLPIVATPSGGTPEIIEDGVCGYLVNKSDPEALAEKLKFLLDNPLTAKSMGQKAKEAVKERFDSLKTTRKLEDIYRNF